MQRVDWRRQQWLGGGGATAAVEGGRSQPWAAGVVQDRRMGRVRWQATCLHAVPSQPAACRTTLEEEVPRSIAAQEAGRLTFRRRTLHRRGPAGPAPPGGSPVQCRPWCRRCRTPAHGGGAGRNRAAGRHREQEGAGRRTAARRTCVPAAVLDQQRTVLRKQETH